MSNSYVLLEKVVVGSAGASSVTFANIPQTGYTDLKVVVSARLDVNDVQLKMYFNADTTAGNYSWRRIYGDGASAVSDSGTNLINGSANGANSTASTFANMEVYIPNYTSSNKKSSSADHVTENNATTAYATMAASLWQGTAAITTITLLPNTSGNFVANSTFYLYGVAKLGTTPTIAPKATGGDVVMTDGTYWYHAFRSSGTFTPAVAFSADCLVIAGGGGGAGFGGGGGAGGLLAYTSQSLTSATNYTITVGAGGTATAYQAVNTGNGNNSQFGSLSAAIAGGGGGSATTNRAGNAGGSGGGSGGHNAGQPTVAGGAGTAGPPIQGYDGGAGTGSTNAWSAGGGGGAGAVGTNPNGKGGIGSSSYSSWGSATSTGENSSGTYYYSGGGSGHGNVTTQTGGLGGGGSGGYAVSGTAGTANTGGGGGSGNGTSGAGGSGIVVVRYLVA